MRLEQYAPHRRRGESGSVECIKTNKHRVVNGMQVLTTSIGAAHCLAGSAVHTISRRPSSRLTFHIPPLCLSTTCTPSLAHHFPLPLPFSRRPSRRLLHPPLLRLVTYLSFYSSLDANWIPSLNKNQT